MLDFAIVCLACAGPQRHSPRIGCGSAAAACSNQPRPVRPGQVGLSDCPSNANALRIGGLQREGIREETVQLRAGALPVGRVRGRELSTGGWRDRNVHGACRGHNQPGLDIGGRIHPSFDSVSKACEIVTQMSIHIARERGLLCETGSAYYRSTRGPSCRVSPFGPVPRRSDIQDINLSSRL